jgi:hypothetical protein
MARIMRAQFDTYRFSVSLSAFRKPFAHGRREARWIDAQSGFKQAFSEGQGVVEFTRASEIAHAEGVQPFERNRFPFAFNYNFRR